MAKLLTLDVTNTIVRVAGSVGQQYSNTAKQFNIILDPALIDRAFRNVWQEYNVRYPNFGASEGFTGHKWWAGVVDQTIRLAGYGVPEVTLRAINEELYNKFTYAESWEILPGSREILEKLMYRKQSRDLTIGIISNNDERLEIVLSNLGLKHNFDFVLCSLVEKSAKPDKGMFLKALELAKVNPEEAIHVGDNVKKDYFGACAVGMRALLLGDRARIPQGVQPKDVITSLDEILRFV